MGSSTKASDWKVQMAGEIVVARTTVWCFEFDSEEANYVKQFIFVGQGVTFGGAIVGTVRTERTSLKCDRAFSADNLDLSLGTAVLGGAAVVVGAGAVIISARTALSGSLFSNQRIAGITLGAGAAFGVSGGLWKKL